MNKKALLTVVVAVSQIISACATKPYPSYTPNTDGLYTGKLEEGRSPSAEEETPWTTWYHKNKIGGLLTLSKIRKDLLANNLHDPHVNYSGYKAVNCSKVNTNFRTADGTCYDLKAPHVGAAGVAFGRNVPPEFIDKDASAKLMDPSPAVISQEFFTRDEFKPVPFLNMLAAVWIQFMNHDWLTHGKNAEKNPYKVAILNGEQEVERTKVNPTNPAQYKKEYGKVTLNDVTHWWDASQIYGSNQGEQNELRSFSKGRMKTVFVNGREVLPKNSSLNIMMNKQNQGYEVTGFRDNWWVGLSMLHTLFVKEHNAIATELMRKHVKYDGKTQKWTWTNGKEVKHFTEKQLDEHIFQTARLINAAILAKIHTVEWTPAILPNPTLKFAMYANWYGAANPQTWSRHLSKLPWFKKTDWNHVNVDDYVIGGIVGQPTNNYGVPFSITEEFTSVYRLHSLLPENINLKRLSEKGKIDAVPFLNTRNDKSYAFMENYDLRDLYYSFGTQLPGQLVLNNFPKFMQNLTIPGHGVMDLGMVDVMRDRERGVPRYNQFRRAISLKPIKSYTDFFPADKPLDARQKAIVEKFNRVYGKDSAGNDNVEMIDLLVGTLSEEVRPSNFGFGETMFHIFILMASRRLMADRFFTTHYKPAYYTQTGLDWIDNEGTFAQVIARHMPELAPSFEGLETAFNPWREAKGFVQLPEGSFEAKSTNVNSIGDRMALLVKKDPSNQNRYVAVLAEYDRLPFIGVAIPRLRITKWVPRMYAYQIDKFKGNQYTMRTLKVNAAGEIEADMKTYPDILTLQQEGNFKNATIHRFDKQSRQLEETITISGPAGSTWEDYVVGKFYGTTDNSGGAYFKDTVNTELSSNNVAHFNQVAVKGQFDVRPSKNAPGMYTFIPRAGVQGAEQVASRIGVFIDIVNWKPLFTTEELLLVNPANPWDVGFYYERH